MRLRFRNEEKDCKPEPTSSENPLYLKLCSFSADAGEKTNDMFVLSRPKVEGDGEDAFLAVQTDEKVFLGVFDGCGGSGAKIYPVFDNHTGAWIASRAAALAAHEWFTDNQENTSLEANIARSLQTCRTQSISGQTLLGSLSREFPTTVAAFIVEKGRDEAEFYWCGDSRCYTLDSRGLHQITMDDSSVHDAMQNLREDAPMTNVASASRPFQLHHTRISIREPSLIFAATDGCFGYLSSPMAFEKMLMETMRCARSMRHWEQLLDKKLKHISGEIGRAHV